MAGQQQQQTPPAGQQQQTPPADAGQQQQQQQTPPAEQKPQGQTPPADQQQQAAKRAPEKYTLTKPEGDHLDDDDIKFVEETARKADWSNEEAQAALVEHNALVAQQAQRYLEAAKADKDYGGEKLAETQRLARKAIDKLRPEGHTRRESFLKFINRAGAGNHPEVLAFLADFGKMIGEDTSTGGQGGSQTEQSVADKLYNGS